MSDNLQIPPDMQLAVSLTATAQYWFSLQRFLDQQAPHWLARPMLDEIQSQCMAQAARQRATRLADGSLAATPQAMQDVLPSNGEEPA